MVRWMDRERESCREVCELLGLDPARVISVTVYGRDVDVVVLDGPHPEDRHTERFVLPDSA